MGAIKVYIMNRCLTDRCRRMLGYWNIIYLRYIATRKRSFISYIIHWSQKAKFLRIMGNVIITNLADIFFHVGKLRANTSKSYSQSVFASISVNSMKAMHRFGKFLL